jgi:hypothetical protein
MLYLRVLLEELRNLLRVRRMALHTQMQCLHSEVKVKRGGSRRIYAQIPD